MATLKYWIAECTNDATCYSLVGKTKNEVWQQVLSNTSSLKFEAPIQRAVVYKDTFDLFDWLTSEGGGRACGERVQKTGATP